MAVTSVTSTGYQSPATSREGIKPSVYDAVKLIGAYDTPLLSKIGKSKVTSPLVHSWITDTVPAAAKNANLEVTDLENANKATKQKTSNSIQIFKNEVVVSESMQAAETYGGKELQHELSKYAKKHALDLEYAMLGLGRDASAKVSVLTAPQTRADATEGEMAGIFYYASKAAGSFTAGKQGNIIAFDSTSDWAGTETALTWDNFNTILQQIWDNGETPKDVFIGANLKKALNAYMTRQYKDEKKYVGVVSSLETDFGTVNVHLHKFLSDAHGLGDVIIAGNFDYVKMGQLVPTKLVDVPTDMTAIAKRYYTEGTLEVRNADAIAIGVGLKAS